MKQVIPDDKPTILTLNRVRKLKRYTKPGTRFRLRTPTWDDRYKAPIYKTVTEEVDRMFPFIVKMKSGRTYTWNEILVALHGKEASMVQPVRTNRRLKAGGRQ